MQENHPTGLLAGSAFAPYKRFRRRRKPWRRDGFAIPNILIPKGGAALWAAESKKKDMTKGHVFLFGTPEGTRTPNIQNRKQKLKNLVSIGALGASGFPIFVVTAFATVAIFLDTGAVQESNPGV